MTRLAGDIVVWLNRMANLLGNLLEPIGWLPGWLSATLTAFVTGIGMLVAFKYTSSQRAIERTRRGIRADLLAISLFEDNLSVVLRAQAGVLGGAIRLLLLAMVPMAVMLGPMSLLMGQLSLWFQARPLRVGDEAAVTVTLAGGEGSPWPTVLLKSTIAAEPTVGPVRVLGKREVCWNLRAKEPGEHTLIFQVGDLPVEKELAVGDGFMRVSVKRPPADWWEALLHPRERPFPPDSQVQAITIAYPERSSWTCGTDSWFMYWCGISLASGFFFRRVLNVHM